MSLRLLVKLGSTLLRTVFVLGVAVTAASAEINTDIIENNLCGKHLFGEAEKVSGKETCPKPRSKRPFFERRAERKCEVQIWVEQDRGDEEIGRPGKESLAAIDMFLMSNDSFSDALH